MHGSLNTRQHVVAPFQKCNITECLWMLPRINNFHECSFFGSVILNSHIGSSMREFLSSSQAKEDMRTNNLFAKKPCKIKVECN